MLKIVLWPKSFFFFLLASLLQVTLHAQEVRVIDNKGTKVMIRNNTVTTGAVAPSLPVENDIWIDTSDPDHQKSKVWNGSTWVDLTFTGIPGSVFFADTDGTPAQDNDQLFWDATNNRLGIGTDSPTHKLQVIGQVRATSFANADGTAGSPSYRFNNDGDTGMFRAATNQLGFSTAGNEALRIDASGQLGIGTPTPLAQVDIESTGVPLRIEPSTTTPTGTSGGQIFMGDDGILYTYDGTRGKWLSVDRTMVGWGRNSNNATNEYLRQFNGAQSNNNGWRMIRDATITAITAQTNIAQSWTLEIRKNDAVAVITSLTMTAEEGNHNNTLNIDVNEGDFIQAFCNGTSIDYPQTLIEIAWRK